MRKAFSFLIPHKRKELPFFIFFAFLITFVLSRVMVYLIMFGPLPEEVFFLHIKGVHIHHLAYGIFLLAIAGYLALMDTNRNHLYKIATLYGVGLGLAFDEFGMWIRLEDDYWTRMSYDAVMVLSGVFLSIIYFDGFWRKMGGLVKEVCKRILRFLSFWKRI